MSFKPNKKAGKSPRTVEVSADGGKTQSMTPEAAARYLQQAASNTSNREVKISFGPSRPPTLESLKETAAREGLPCSEAEMKALMGMFVEIMGMGMDGKKGAADSASMSRTGSMPMVFGKDGPGGANWPDHESLAAATAGLFADGASWDAIRKTYGAVYQGSEKVTDDFIEDDDDEDESIPDLDDYPNTDLKNTMASQDWEVLGKMSADEAFAAQERARRAAKNREKKHRRRQKQRDDAVAKATEDALRQREAEILSWRSQVVSACHSHDVAQFDLLIDESPFLDDDDDDSDILPHLEYLLAYALPKSRNHVDKGKEIRCKLASFLLDEELHLAFEPMHSGRPILHAACFLGDLALVELILEKLEQYFQTHANDRHPFLAREDLDITCADAGWAALHYAAMSGSPQVLEVLLRAGCNVGAITDPSLTCRKR
jgi:Ankyrin repeats (3 copies)